MSDLFLYQAIRWLHAEKDEIERVISILEGVRRVRPVGGPGRKSMSDAERMEGSVRMRK
jgi:hypothetical protein